MGAKSGRNKRAAKGSGKGGDAKRRGSKGGGVGARQRLGLVLFGAVFIALFVIFAVAQGIGAPSVPSGDAALVQGVSDGHVSEAEVKRGLAQQIASAQLKKPPKPGSKKYEELKTAALGELLSNVWVSGEAEELGITVTEKQIAASLAEIKKQNFKTEKAFEEFLQESHLTAADVNDRVKLQLYSKDIQEKVQNEAGPASQAEIEAYYNENKATQFTTKPSRDVRVVVNKDKKKVEAAKEALDEDNSVANWKKVAAKYSSDTTTNQNAGLQKGISEEFLKGDLKKAVFDSATGEVVGPVEFEKNFLLIEVVKLHPQKVQTLAEAKTTISGQLTQTKQQEFFNEFVSGFQVKWETRTFCAAGYVIERCSNFKGESTFRKEHASCYEANPKAPPKECPAPVQLNAPTLPGTVTSLKPKGEPLVQRPQPEGLSAGGAATELTPEGAEGAEGAAGSSAEAEAAAAAQAQAEAEAKAAGGE